MSGDANILSPINYDDEWYTHADSSHLRTGLDSVDEAYQDLSLDELYNSLEQQDVFKTTGEMSPHLDYTLEEQDFVENSYSTNELKSINEVLASSEVEARCTSSASLVVPQPHFLALATNGKLQNSSGKFDGHVVPEPLDKSLYMYSTWVPGSKFSNSFSGPSREGYSRERAPLFSSPEGLETDEQPLVDAKPKVRFQSHGLHNVQARQGFERGVQSASLAPRAFAYGGAPAQYSSVTQEMGKTGGLSRGPSRMLMSPGIQEGGTYMDPKDECDVTPLSRPLSLSRSRPMSRSQSSIALGRERPVSMMPLSPPSETSSYSSRGSPPHSFEQGDCTSASLQTQTDLQNVGFSSFNVQQSSMRRAQSTGDLQRPLMFQYGRLGTASPEYGGGPRKIGNYCPEDREVMLQRFKVKRGQRNFNKKIKYECRKSLAEKRPRVQGRFAKNEEEIPANTYHTVIRKREIHHEGKQMGEEDRFLLDESSSWDFSDLALLRRLQ